MWLSLSWPACQRRPQVWACGPPLLPPGHEPRDGRWRGSFCVTRSVCSRSGPAWALGTRSLLWTTLGTLAGPSAPGTAGVILPLHTGPVQALGGVGSSFRGRCSVGWRPGGLGTLSASVWMRCWAPTPAPLNLTWVLRGQWARGTAPGFLRARGVDRGHAVSSGAQKPRGRGWGMPGGPSWLSALLSMQPPRRAFADCDVLWLRVKAVVLSLRMPLCDSVPGRLHCDLVPHRPRLCSSLRDTRGAFL